MSWCRVTATRWGSARQRLHTPSCVSSSHTGQWRVVKYCEMVPFLPASSPPAAAAAAEHDAFWICEQRKATWQLLLSDNHCGRDPKN